MDSVSLFPSPPFRGEREGTRRVSDGEGEAGLGSRSGIPHLTPTLSAPKGGEGNLQLSAYRHQHTANIFHHIPIPEPDYPIASPGDFPAPKFIRTRRVRVSSAIEFNHELRRRTGEVDDVSTDRVLPAKPVRKPEFT